MIKDQAGRLVCLEEGKASFAGHPLESKVFFLHICWIYKSGPEKFFFWGVGGARVKLSSENKNFRLERYLTL